MPLRVSGQNANLEKAEFIDFSNATSLERYISQLNRELKELLRDPHALLANGSAAQSLDHSDQFVLTKHVFPLSLHVVFRAEGTSQSAPTTTAVNAKILNELPRSLRRLFSHSNFRADDSFPTQGFAQSMFVLVQRAQRHAADYNDLEACVNTAQDIENVITLAMRSLGDLAVPVFVLAPDSNDSLFHVLKLRASSFRIRGTWCEAGFSVTCRQKQISAATAFNCFFRPGTAVSEEATLRRFFTKLTCDTRSSNEEIELASSLFLSKAYVYGAIMPPRMRHYARLSPAYLVQWGVKEFDGTVGGDLGGSDTVHNVQLLAETAFTGEETWTLQCSFRSLPTEGDLQLSTALEWFFCLAKQARMYDDWADLDADAPGTQHSAVQDEIFVEWIFDDLRSSDQSSDGFNAVVDSGDDHGDQSATSGDAELVAFLRHINAMRRHLTSDHFVPLLSHPRNAPPNSLFERFCAVLLRLCQGKRQCDLSRVCRLWRLFCDRVSRHWRQKLELPFVELPMPPSPEADWSPRQRAERAHPDFRCCELQQLLQMQRICTERLLQQRLFDPPQSPSHEEALGVRRVLTGMPMCNNPSRDIREPYTQPHAPCTSAQLQQRNRSTHPTEKEAQLGSDVAAFKAANPGAVFADFVRWYSPKDWHPEEEVEVQDTDLPKHLWRSICPRGSLSARMVPETTSVSTTADTSDTDDGAVEVDDDDNLWHRVWKSTEPCQVAKQTPLFDAQREGEKTLRKLADLTPLQLFNELARTVPVVAMRALASSLSVFPFLQHCKSVQAEFAHLRNALSACVIPNENDEEVVDCNAALRDLCPALREAESNSADALSLAALLKQNDNDINGNQRSSHSNGGDGDQDYLMQALVIDGLLREGRVRITAQQRCLAVRLLRLGHTNEHEDSAHFDTASNTFDSASSDRESANCLPEALAKHFVAVALTRMRRRPLDWMRAAPQRVYIRAVSPVVSRHRAENHVLRQGALRCLPTFRGNASSDAEAFLAGDAGDNVVAVTSSVSLF